MQTPDEINNMNPHPGEYLLDELNERGWKQVDLADVMGVSEQRINEIATGKRSITRDTAQLLEAALGIDAQHWLNLEAVYRLARVRSDTQHSTVAQRARLYAKAPVREMVRRRWIEPSNDIDVLQRRILDFLGTETLDETPTVWHAARKGTSYGVDNPAQATWLIRARKLARAVDAGQFSDKSLDKAFQSLKIFTKNAEDVRHVPRVLAEAGVRLVIVEGLEHARIDGACLWLDEKSPVVALSLRYDRIDNFWHNLMHELGHVRRHHGLEGYKPVDANLPPDGMSDDQNKPPQEREVDQFAAEFLVPQEALESFIRRTRPLYSGVKIARFAALHQIHPGIVVGQLHHRRDQSDVQYTHFRRTLEKVRHIVTQSALTDGWGHTVPAGL